MQKRALITGVNGQDGSYLAELLLGKDYKVIGMVRRSSQNHLNNISDIMRHPDFRLVYGDVTDFSSLGRILKEHNPHEVYNLAAQSHVRISFDEPLHTTEVVGQGALNLFEAVRMFTFSAYVYQASSSEQFGTSLGLLTNSPVNPDDSKAGNASYLQDESTPFCPQSPYGAAKVFAHNCAVMYRNAYGMNISCGILFNHESERRGENFVSRKITKYMGQLYWHLRRSYPDKYSNLSLEELEKAMLRFPKLQLGNLDAYRDWGHAEDYVYAMWLILQQDKPDDYVISTGNTYKVSDFLYKAGKMIGLSQEHVNKVVEINPQLLRPAEVPYLKGNSLKARNQLGWKPRVDFDGLVRRMLQKDTGA